MRCDACELPLTAASVPKGFLRTQHSGKRVCSLSCAEVFEDAIGLAQGDHWEWTTWERERAAAAPDATDAATADETPLS